MSQENVEFVRLGFEAYQQGNWDLVEENSHPDLLIVQPPEVPDAKTYRGPHAFADAAADWPSEWEDFQMELVELIDVDDERVISVTRHHGRGAESGIEMVFTVAYLHTLRDSKLIRLDMFFNRAQARDFARSISGISLRSIARQHQASGASGSTNGNGHGANKAEPGAKAFGPVARAVASSVKPQQ